MNTNTLRKLLSILVDDCGYDAVRNVLDDFSPAQTDKSASRNNGSSVKRPGKPRAKLGAVAVVSSLASIDEEKRIS